MFEPRAPHALAGHDCLFRTRPAIGGPGCVVSVLGRWSDCGGQIWVSDGRGGVLTCEHPLLLAYVMRLRAEGLRPDGEPLLVSRRAWDGQGHVRFLADPGELGIIDAPGLGGLVSIDVAGLVSTQRSDDQAEGGTAGA